MSIWKGPIAYGALLAVALGLAWQTWTRERAIVQLGTVQVWAGAPADIVQVEFFGKNGHVRVERRTDEDSSYFWGSNEAAIHDPADNDNSKTPTTQTTEFPIGEEGDKLMDKLAPLMAERDLGVLDDKKMQDYTLANAKDRLIVSFKSSQHELTVGDRVYGGDDVYVLDPTTKRGYVMATDIIRILQSAASDLREKKMHSFNPEQVAKVVVRAGDKEKTYLRKPGPMGDDGQLGRPTYFLESSSDKPDKTFANLMDQVNRLQPLGFEPGLKEDGMPQVAMIECSIARF